MRLKKQWLRRLAENSLRVTPRSASALSLICAFCFAFFGQCAQSDAKPLAVLLLAQYSPSATGSVAAFSELKLPNDWFAHA